MGGRPCTSVYGRIVRVIVACALVGGLTAACATANPDGGSQRSSSPSPIATPSPEVTPSPTATPTATTQQCVVGVSWFNQEADDIPDWEEPALQKAVLDAGAVFLEKNDKSFLPGQGGDIDALVAAGAKVIVVEPGMGGDYLPAVQRAINAGIPVIATFQAIEHARTLYVAYDPVEEGRQEARALLAAKPKGNYLIIKDHYSLSPDGDLIAAGVLEILQPAVDRGDIKILATIEWGVPNDPALELTAFLSQKRGELDAVAVEGGTGSTSVQDVQQTLAEANLSGKVAVAGLMSSAWDGFRHIVDGTQVVEVWWNPERLGTVIAQVAIALCHDPDITRVAGSASLTWPGHDPLTAVLLAPIAITKDNLSVVIQTNTRWREMICNTDGRVYVAPPACQVGPGSTESAAAPS